MRSADQNVGMFGGCLFCFVSGNRYIYLSGLWRQGGQSWKVKAGDLVTFEILIFLGIYVDSIIIDNCLTMLPWEWLKDHRHCQYHHGPVL